MGSSADAVIGWGIDFGNPGYTTDYEDSFDWEEAGVDKDAFEDMVLPELFGFTEHSPQIEREPWLALTPQERLDWRERYRAPWEKRRDIAIPLEFISYGYEFNGTALVLKRSLTRVEWGAVEISPGSLADPSAAELAAFGVVAQQLGYIKPVQLLLMARYG